ncbi:hypothetical protein OH76DRAFT_1184561 [Lentinus brumalis]|uniref:Uncharacterized protein n=1 Tax=Lentinus brumalis TaxID=2498619 RepID=A0A371CU43_9APHY|nr:hypothetical protein OH76DRAFT_1184561 [Polyporus brumalis]
MSCAFEVSSGCFSTLWSDCGAPSAAPQTQGPRVSNRVVERRVSSSASNKHGLGYPQGQACCSADFPRLREYVFPHSAAPSVCALCRPRLRLVLAREEDSY